MVDRSRRRNTAFKIGVHVHRRTQSQSSAATCPPGRSASDTALSRVLWDEAYDNLRLDPSTSSLVVAYEAIISQELPDDLKFSAHSRVSLPREGDLETCDRRRELMIAIVRAGLNKRRGSKASQVDDMARQLLTCVKGKVESAWGEFSSAATAWSGLCTLTPLLIDPILRHEHFRKGMLHIAGRIHWYMELVRLLQRPMWDKNADYSSRGYKTRDAVLRLYRKILEYEMNCVCATASAWNTVAKHVVRWNTMGKLIEEIIEADEAVYGFVTTCLAEDQQKQLLQLNADLDLEELERSAKLEMQNTSSSEITEEEA